MGRIFSKLKNPRGLLMPLVKQMAGVAAYIYTEKAVESDTVKWAIYAALGLMVGVWFPVARRVMAVTGWDNDIASASEKR